jgi:hypothetical protein
MESHSRLFALFGLLVALPGTLFWTGVAGIPICLLCLLIFGKYFWEATVFFTTIFFIALNVQSYREFRE